MTWNSLFAYGGSKHKPIAEIEKQVQSVELSENTTCTPIIKKNLSCHVRTQLPVYFHKEKQVGNKRSNLGIVSPPPFFFLVKSRYGDTKNRRGLLLIEGTFRNKGS